MAALNEERATLRAVAEEEDASGEGLLAGEEHRQEDQGSSFRVAPEHDLKTNWLHRGDREPLKSMGIYHYAMYVYTAQGRPLRFGRKIS